MTNFGGTDSIKNKNYNDISEKYTKQFRFAHYTCAKKPYKKYYKKKRVNPVMYRENVFGTAFRLSLYQNSIRKTHSQKTQK